MDERLPDPPSPVTPSAAPPTAMPPAASTAVVPPVTPPVTAPPAAPQPAAPPTAMPSAVPQRHYVHHSYIWLGTLRAAGIIIVALGVSLFSSVVGAFFEDGGHANGFLMMIAGLCVAGAILFVVLLCLAYQWWSYKHLWYEIGDEEFSLYSGIFNKKRVHVPYQRVQSVDQHASLVQRIFGVCTVHVDTAGGAAHTAVTIPYLRKDQAEHLRMELYLRKRRILGIDEAGRAVSSSSQRSVASAAMPQPGLSATSQHPAGAASPLDASSAAVPPASGASATAPTPGAPAAAAPAPVAAAVTASAAAHKPGNVLDIGAEAWGDVRGVFAGDAVNMGASSYEYGLTNKELLFTALSNNTGFVLAIIGALCTLFQVVSGLMDVTGGRAETLGSLALSMGASLFGGSMIVLGIVAGLVVVLVLWVISVAGTCLQFGGFEARRRGSRIEVEHGLLQHRIRGVDVDRVQSVVVKQSVIRRLLGYCELSLGKIDAVDGSQGEQNQGLEQSGLVIHPFVKLDRVPEILAGIIPEFADVPVEQTPVAPVALRRAVIRRGVLQGAGFWIAVLIAIAQVLVNLLWHPTDPAGQLTLFYLNGGAWAGYAVCAVVFALEVVAAVLWARGSGFAYNRRFMQVANGGMAREVVSFPRRKIQFGFTKTNPFQRRAKTATISVRTAAGTGGTTVRLIDVCEDDAQAWLDWVRPHTNAV